MTLAKISMKPQHLLQILPNTHARNSEGGNRYPPQSIRKKQKNPLFANKKIQKKQLKRRLQSVFLCFGGTHQRIELCFNHMTVNLNMYRLSLHMPYRPIGRLMRWLSHTMYSLPSCTRGLNPYVTIVKRRPYPSEVQLHLIPQLIKSGIRFSDRPF